MSEKATIKRKLKATKRYQITKRLENGVEIPVKNIYINHIYIYIKINHIDIDKIRVSDKKLYNKEHGSYKHYFFMKMVMNTFL